MAGSRVVWVTASGTELDHAVSPQGARFGRPGNHEAVCGAEFRAAPLVADPGRQCVACLHCLAEGGPYSIPNHGLPGADGPLARWRRSFRPQNPTAARIPPNAAPHIAVGQRAWQGSEPTVPRQSVREPCHAPSQDSEETKRRYPVDRFLRHELAANEVRRVDVHPY